MRTETDWKKAKQNTAVNPQKVIFQKIAHKKLIHEAELPDTEAESRSALSQTSAAPLLCSREGESQPHLLSQVQVGNRSKQLLLKAKHKTITERNISGFS